MKITAKIKKETFFIKGKNGKFKISDHEWNPTISGLNYGILSCDKQKNLNKKMLRKNLPNI